MENLGGITEYLKSREIPFEVADGGLLRSAEVTSVIDEPQCHITKTLLLTDKRKTLHIVTVLSTSKSNLKDLSKHLCTTNLRYANLSQVNDQLDLKSESVSVFLLRHKKMENVQCSMDASLRDVKGTLRIPLTENGPSIDMTLDSFLRFLDEAGHSVTWVDCSQVPELKKKESDTACSKVALETQPNLTTTSLGTEILGVTVKKHQNFSEWYSQILVKGELVEYYDVSGCYILRPSAYFIWETIQKEVNEYLKEMEVENCYFPMFVTKKKLEIEKNHVEGFSPEVAWVCRYGDSELSEPIALRPTSETIIYPSLARWIRSHRDLPMKLNQWCPVVRWEFKQPTPFIRTREFLWQEGHTAHETEEEAQNFMLRSLSMYKRVYEDLLAVPVVAGQKSEGEKFAGAKRTCTVEAFVSANGRAIQAATSHFFGTNFSRMFNIVFEDRNKQKQYVHQTSWGFTTRSLGVILMIHGDDKGLVLPPFVAPVQVVIIPIIYKSVSMDEVVQKCKELGKELSKVNLRVKVDDRDSYTAGWKYNYWEMKGACLRLEIGPRDMQQKTVRVVRRDNAEISVLTWEELPITIPALLKTIHSEMFHKAENTLKESIVQATCWDEVVEALCNKKMILAPWSEDPESEELIKKESVRLCDSSGHEKEENSTTLSGAMKPLCIPFDQPPMPHDTKCFATGRPASRWCLFGRSY